MARPTELYAAALAPWALLKRSQVRRSKQRSRFPQCSQRKKAGSTPPFSLLTNAMYGSDMATAIQVRDERSMRRTNITRAIPAAQNSA